MKIVLWQKRVWKLKYFSYFISFFILFCFVLQANAEIYVIDAEKNSVTHNNLGMNYFNEGYYYGAIQEFKIAISLNPSSQSSASYYDNLGRTYLRIGYPKMASDAFENSVELNPMNFKYRENLITSYKRQGKKVIDKKLDEYLKSDNPLDTVMVGLIYIANGDTEAGVIKLDEFCINQYNLILSSGVRDYLSRLGK